MADQLTPEQLAQLAQANRYYTSIGLSTETIRRNTEILKGDTKALAEAARVAEDYFDRMSFSTRDLASTFSNVLEDVKGLNTNANKGVAAFKQLNGIAEDLARHQEGINKLDTKELENLQKKFTKNKSILFDSIDLIQNKKSELKVGEQLSALEENLLKEYGEAKALGLDRLKIEEILGKKIQDELDKEKNITKELNIRGAVLKGAIGLMDKLGLSAFTQVMHLEDANNKLREEYEKTGNLKAAFKSATDQLFKGLKHALQDPATSLVVYGTIAKKALGSVYNDLKGMVHEALAINAHSAELGRSLGTSASNAHHMVEEAKSAGRAMGDVTLAGKEYAKAIGEANAALGLNVDLGGKTTHEFAKMTEMMGLSAEEATQIYKLSALNNQELTDTNKTIAAGIISAQKQYGIQVNARQVFQAIGKLSAATLANFKQNPEALAKAVVQAKALGSDLDKMDAAAQSLLNFESSIQNELEAELLTGKQINLEKARAAALNNDQVGYMNAIAEQTGTLVEFNQKNRLQQEALAKAFGMSRADMAEMLQQQEVYNKLGDVTGKSAAEQLEIAHQRGLSEQDSLVVSLQQQAASEKLAKTFEGIKETIAGLVEGPLGRLVKGMAEFLNSTAGVATLIGIMATSGIIKLIVGFGALIKAAKALKALEIGSAIASGWRAAMSSPASLLTGGLAGLALGGILTAAIMSSINSTKADDMFSGYGNRTLVTPKGSYALNNNDTVIAGTNLFRGNDVISGPVDSINLTGGVESKLESMTKSIADLASRPIQLTAGTNVIQNWNTAQTQYGAPNSFV